MERNDRMCALVYIKQFIEKKREQLSKEPRKKLPVS